MKMKVKRILKIVCIHFDVSRYADSRNSFDFSIACFVQKIQSFNWVRTMWLRLVVRVYLLNR